MNIDKRYARRDLVTVPIEYAYSCIDDKNELVCASGKGVTLNLSREGISLYTSQPIREGIDVKVFSKSIWDAPRNAMVRWCSKINDNIYRIGLSLS